MIDLHCHILPGIDDGPRDLQASIALARASYDNGIRQAVVTPHVYPGRWDNTLSSLRPHFLTLKSALVEAQIDLDIYLGGEAHLLPEVLELLTANELPFLGGWNGKRVLLLELPDARIPIGASKAVDLLLEHDVVPMIAHPERNKEVMRDPKTIWPFVRAGCLLQLTAASVCGSFGRQAHTTALSLMDTGCVTIVATDTHNLVHRPPMLNEARLAINARYGNDAGEILTVKNPGLILSGREALTLND